MGQGGSKAVGSKGGRILRYSQNKGSQSQNAEITRRLSMRAQLQPDCSKLSTRIYIQAWIKRTRNLTQCMASNETVISVKMLLLDKICVFCSKPARS